MNGRQPETRAIMKWLREIQFTASASLHGVIHLLVFPAMIVTFSVVHKHTHATWYHTFTWVVLAINVNLQKESFRILCHNGDLHVGKILLFLSNLWISLFWDKEVHLHMRYKLQHSLYQAKSNCISACYPWSLFQNWLLKRLLGKKDVQLFCKITLYNVAP